MIRVTTNQLHQTSLRAVNDSRARMQEAQQVALTGRRVATASDDPAAAARARVLGGLTADAESHVSNTVHGVARLQAAEDALAEAGNQLLRAKEIALAMSNDTLAAEQRDASATEVGQILRTVTDLMNKQHLGEYVFAHVDTRTAPYDPATASFTYDVDTYQSVRRVEVGPSQMADIGASGSHAFAARAADPSSVDVPAVLASLQTSLDANDPDAIRASIDAVTQAYDQVLAERTNTGVRMARLKDAERAAEQASSVYTSLTGELIDADAAQAFSNLTLTETTMRAAVTVAARILGPTLLDAL